MLMDNLRIAQELIEATMMIIAAKPSGLPTIGKYHNNPSSLDAYVVRKYQKEFDSKCKAEIIKNKIPIKDYYDALRNLKSLFSNAIPSSIEKGRTSSYNVQHFSTDSVINGKQYHIKIKVLIPTEEQKERSRKNPDPKNGEDKAKIKWLYMTKK